VGLLSANLKCLAQTQPELADALSRMTATGEGAIALTDGGDHFAWSCGGKAGVLPKKQAAGLETILPGRRFYVVYGAGHLEALRRLSELPGPTHILVFEPSLTLLRALFDAHDFRFLFNGGNVHLIAGDSINDYLKQLEAYFAASPDRIFAVGNSSNLVCIGVQTLPKYQDCCLRFAEKFQAAVSNIVNRDVAFAQEDSYNGLKNSLLNAKSYVTYPDIVSFAGKYKNLPGVLIGSGPSLSHSLPYLKSLQGKAVLIACDSALAPLLRAGIVPDFTVCIERVSATKRLYEDLPKDLKTVLIAPSMVHPDTFTTYPGKKIAIFRDVGFDAWLFPRHERNWIGMTVGHLGLRALEILGCRDIYFVGVDCAYDPDTGASHDEGVSDFILKYGEWEKNENVGVSKIEMVGYEGQKMLTMSFWYLDTFTFDDMIARFGLNVRNVMPTRYGIPLPRTTRVDPAHLGELSAAAKPIPPLNLQLQSDGEDAAILQMVLIAGEDFLKKTAGECLEILALISDVWHENDPCIADRLPVFDELFCRIEDARTRIQDFSGAFFWTILSNILHYALLRNRFLLEKCAVDHRDLGLRYIEQVQLHIEWFRKVHSWCDRILHYIERRRVLVAEVRAEAGRACN
jgi:hypothetical protein